MSIASSAAPVKDEPALVRRLRRQDFEPGTPEHVTEETKATDRRMCRFARCGACRRHGLNYQPFTDGRAYRVVATCNGCGIAEEF